MAILDLDKIIFTKPETGIHCIKCGGDLKKTDKKQLLGRIIMIATFGKAKGTYYQCVCCKKKYMVI